MMIYKRQKKGDKDMAAEAQYQQMQREQERRTQ
jgi:hypothetical protein